ncbi:hypothetical protein CF336_g9571, partial [Tilletia laevis]
MALSIPPVDRKLLTSTYPFGIHPPELIQTVQCQGQRLSWPSPSYNFEGIYDTLFVLPTPASAPGTIVIRSHLRRKGNALDNRGAGPYGPQGLLWILAALRRRAQIMQLSPQQMSSLCRTAIPDLASSLLSVDSGLSIENARRQIQDGRAYGHLVFPVDIGCLTNLSPSFQQVHHQQQVQPPALIPLSLPATHQSQTRGTKRAPTSPAESVSKRPTLLPASGSKGVPAQPVSQQSSKTLVVPTLAAPAARQPPKTVQADPRGVSTLHLSPDTPESPKSANLARSDTIARLLQRATPFPCATSGDRSPAPLAATGASQRESAQADILAAEDDDDISETALDNFLATYRPNLDPEDSPPPPIRKNTLKGTSPLPVRHRQHSTQGTSTQPILQRQYSSKGTST